jgi:hypothetical protein
MTPMGRRINMDNAAVLGYATDNLDAMQSQVEEVLYTEYRLDQFVPIFTDVPEGAQTYSYIIADGRGDAGWIDRRGTNAGSARVNLSRVAYELDLLGVWAEWSKEDLRASMLTSVSLDDETIKFASRSGMDFIERVGLSGDTDKGWQGLVNQTTGTAGNTVRLTTNANAARFSALTGDQMADAIAAQVSLLIADSSEIIGRTLKEGMSVYLPIRQHNLVTTKRLVDSPNLTAWEWVKTNNQFSALTGGKELALHMVAELGDAAANGTDDRMIVGMNTREVMEMAQPIMPRTLQVLDMGFHIQVPIEAKISALNVKRPIGLRYVDNV